ncbi:pisatin demethylase [Aspergillus campestris IBT 28561]|uniref:Pisatin demethylase n=1 Tax=Aspergillus campestris (strain IBT 28561) TaxID=1392248 RepID=A0A2I1D8D4_ASPC2|nr:pisatin demethylase [Aspergillus campestris IBT 28561]PKY06141.1 pisatin demethylase [Aspergillus campestris IBT 28561]
MTLLYIALSGPILFVTVVAVVAHRLYGFIHDPLRRVPGPWLARFTRLWELVQICGGHFEQINLDLHRRYGPVVRVTPDRYSIASPGAVRKIYSHGSGFTKARWYRAFGDPEDSQADMFSVTDEQRHAAHRRKVATMFSMTSAVSYEPFIDACTAILVEELGQQSRLGETVSIPQWMQYYAFDVISEMTIGASFGMMRTGGDNDGILQTIHSFLTYSSRMSVFVELHAWIVWVSHLFGSPNPIENIHAYGARQLAARRQQPSDRADFIQKLADLQDAGKISELELFNTVEANFAAGSDTIGLTVSAVIYYLAQHPRCAQRLRREVDTRASAGRVSFSEAQQMPYLQAVLKEILRVHPAVGMPLPRGYFFPAGTVVGVNAWVLHRDPTIFGDDAHLFRPERWLGHKDEVASMERHLFSFGAGSRTCIGKNISLIELNKLVPELYRHFEFELEGDEWQTENVFFVKPSFRCRVVSREGLL